MYKTFIENYIKKMTLSDLKEYCKKNYPKVTEEEIKVIYRYLKTRWVDLYEENPLVLEEIKKEVSVDTYLEITKLLQMAYQFKKR